MGRATVGPFEGPGGLVVVPQIAHDFALEVELGAKDAARDHLALELAKPELDLVEPGRVSRSKMELHLPMALQKLRHRLGFVDREIVGDDVHLTSRRLMSQQIAQESDELGAGMAGDCLAQDL